MTGQQKLAVVTLNPLERGNERGEMGAVVRVDHAHATVLVDVIAREQELSHLETELAGGVAWCVPDVEFEIADADAVALFEFDIDLAAGHGQVEPLRLD